MADEKNTTTKQQDEQPEQADLEVTEEQADDVKGAGVSVRHGADREPQAGAFRH
jgi:hypothetical protein